MALPDIQTNDPAHERWLDKLWESLFDGNTGGLMSPGQIRREHRNRDQVRQAEMSAILHAEQELTDIHRGIKSLDDNGNVIDTPKVGDVVTHKIIENTSIERDLDVGLDTPGAMIRSVVKELSIRDLERSLNLRKIALLAESEILHSSVQVISSSPINAEWLERWRGFSASIFNPEMQPIWAKVLVLELAHPGTYSLGLLSTLMQLNGNDLEMVRIMAKYAFPDFIYYAEDGYFSADLHDGLFDVMEDLGLLSTSSVNKTLSSESKQYFELILPCTGKALKFTHKDASKKLQLPVLKLTRVGKQVVMLLENKADLAYLFDLARNVKRLGYDVTLGDYEQYGAVKSFTEKMVL